MQVEPDHWYRVWARVSRVAQDRVAAGLPPATSQIAVEHAVDGALQTQGFDPAVVVVQDPTARDLFTLVARYVGGGSPGPADDFAIAKVEEIAPPRPVVFPATSTLDVGLSEDQIAAVRFALEADSDPTRLGAMADSFDEDFPIVAALLHAKANLETTARDGFQGRQEGGRTGGQGARGLVSRLRDSSRELGSGVQDMWNTYQPLEEKLPPARPRVSAILGPLLSQLDRVPYATRAKRIGREISLAVRGAPPYTDLGAVYDAGGGVNLADPAVSRQLMPLGPAPVSKSAIKILSSSLKPVSTGIFDPSKVRTRVRGGRAADPRVNESLARAQKFLDRRTWTNYYLGMRDSGLM